ncbi:MAG: hypothetical protein KQI78_13705 [Deltaproteobacteria bacterium]|nr:hypothetical protein [Deltaproteobacteria bacterium]
MNPLVNRDLNTYVKELVDHYIAGKACKDKEPAGCEKTSPNRSDDTNPSTVKKGRNERKRHQTLHK